ncbi:MAG: hypothetical protein LBU60_00430 [Clostridiales bacterium]|jgi:hypothetical protein|nr:hypothetical protein [Clostridiales bacterium]
MFDVFEGYDNPRFKERGLLISKIVKLEKLIKLICFCHSLFTFMIATISLVVKYILSILYAYDFLLLEAYIVVFNISGILLYMLFGKYKFKNRSKLYTIIYCLEVLNLIVVVLIFGIQLDKIFEYKDYVFASLFMLVWVAVLSVNFIILLLKITKRKLHELQ